LRFEVSPDDAIVEIDGEAVTRTAPFVLDLPPDSYRLAVRRKGYRAWVSQVDLEPGGKHSFGISLERSADRPSRIAVRSDRPGLIVSIDGRELAQRTPVVVEVAAGEHRIALVDDRGEAWAERIVVDADTYYEVQADLHRRSRTRDAGDTPVPTGTTALRDEEAADEIPPIAVAASDVVRIAGGVPTLRMDSRPASGFATVTARLCLDARGHVSAVAILDGPADATAKLARALARWRYQPYLRDGAPVPVCFGTSLSVEVAPVSEG
jgi:hypothetical protein